MKLDQFDKGTKNRSVFPTLVLAVAGLLVLALAAGFWLVGEMGKPQVVIAGDISRIGLTRQVSFVASDAGSGLRSIEVAMVQEGKKAVLLAVRGLLWGALVAAVFGLYQFFGDMVGLPISATLLKFGYDKTTFGFARIQAFSQEPLYFSNYLYWRLTLTRFFLEVDD